MKITVFRGGLLGGLVGAGGVLVSEGIREGFEWLTDEAMANWVQKLILFIVMFVSFGCLFYWIGFHKKNDDSSEDS